MNDARRSVRMAGKLSAKAKAKAKAKITKKGSGFSVFQVVSGMVGVGLCAVLAFHLAPVVASLIVSGCLVAGTYALQATGRI
jgi:hypothetical protein